MTPDSPHLPRIPDPSICSVLCRDMDHAMLHGTDAADEAANEAATPAVYWPVDVAVEGAVYWPVWEGFAP